ncbi:MAG: ATP-dependent DNA helicase [Candidatus Woesearchaeota archaeon]|jgi:DNA excision repair protein ERCC-2
MADEYVPEIKEEEQTKADISLTKQLEELKHGKSVDVSIEDLFPHEVIRKGQDELVKDIDQVFSEKKVLLAHAPTGLGKTASALSVALKHAFKEKKKVFFLTNRHTQHQIAIHTLKLMQKRYKKDIPCIDLIGKKHMCNQDVAALFGVEFTEFCKAVVEKGECEFYNNVRTGKETKELTVEAKLALKELKLKGPIHNEELTQFCKDRNLCSYEMALFLAKEAKVLIGDYNYLFNSFVSKTILTKLGVEMEDIILVLDEGHNLPGRVTEMMSSVLNTNMLKNGIYEAKKYGYGGVISWLQEINRILLKLGQFDPQDRDKEKKVTKNDFWLELTKVVEWDQLHEELEFAADEIRRKQRKSYLGGIVGFLENWRGEDEGYLRYVSLRNSRYGEITSLHYSCLDPSLVTSTIFKRVHAAVVMSGTLKPAFMYKDVLGIGERAVMKEYFSPFPSENKLSLIIPETTTKYTARNELMYQKIAEYCSNICKLVPGNVALFFPSYDLRDTICKHLISRKKLFWEKSEMNKEEKDLLLEEFKAEKDRGAVLLGVAGANFAEGIDLPGDLLNGVVVVGLPLAKPDLVTKEIINYHDQKFHKGWDYGYIFPAMNKCFQSAGRCIRSETDRGVIIFLDERFTWQNYFVCFPKEGLIVSKDYQRLLTNFFNMGN